MRVLSVFLGLALICGAASAAGSAEGNLPGAGTFAYAGAPLASDVAVSAAVAVR